MKFKLVQFVKFKDIQNILKTKFNTKEFITIRDEIEYLFDFIQQQIKMDNYPFENMTLQISIWNTRMTKFGIKFSEGIISIEK